MRRHWWVAVWTTCLLAGCDSVFGIDHVGPYTGPPDAPIDAPIQLGWKATTTGDAHSCGIRADDTLWCWGGNTVFEVGTASTAGVVDHPTHVGTQLFAQVSSSRNHSCAITLTGDLYCWGYNGYLQLGTGNGTYAPVPALIPGAWKQVSAATYHTCAIKTDDTLWCWGDNSYNTLGTGVTDQAEPLPVQIGTDHWLDVDGGEYQSCGVQVDNSLWCWGNNSYGALGNGTFDEAVAPTAASGEAWLDVSVGTHVACGRTMTNALRCWGSGYGGELGAGMSVQGTPSPVAVPIDGIEYEDWVQVSIEDQYGCAIRANGSLWCWGRASHNQLGTAFADGMSYVPVQMVNGASSWRRVATSIDHTCAIDTDNQLWCWGASSRAQLGDPTNAHSRPTLIPGAYSKISAGGNVTCGLQAGTSAPQCAGRNASGTVGDGTTIDRQSMTPLLTAQVPWTTISAGPAASCGDPATPTPTTYCWGYNYYGALGDNTMTTRYTPGPIVGYVNPVSTSDHTCGLNGSGAFCWGYNGSGQLGDNSTMTRLAAVAVMNAGASISITTGSSHTCSISTSGAAFCWGSNNLGQLGNGSATTALVATPVTSSLTGPIAQIAAGYWHTCAVATDSKLYCWGYNYTGQLGTGDRLARYSPTRIGTRLWRMVTTGDDYTCAIGMDMTLWCWGRNARGQLGVGTFDDRFLPIQVGQDSDWSTVDAGFEHTCAQKTGGQTWCWGANDFGQVPDGSAWRTQPVNVP